MLVTAVINLMRRNHNVMVSAGRLLLFRADAVRAIGILGAQWLRQYLRNLPTRTPVVPSQNSVEPPAL